ncbi:MAG: O-antigen ligase family protein [Hyphomicrobiaceae bacterium]
MLSDPAEARSRPLRSRWRGIVFGTFLMIAAAGMLVASRAAPFYLLGVLLASFFVADWRRVLRIRLDVAFPVLVPALLLALFAGLSALWAQAPAAALEKSAVAVAVVVATAIIVAAMDQFDRMERLHVSEGLWIGVLAGVTFAAIEIYSGQIILRSLVNLLKLPQGSLTPPEFYRFTRGGYLFWISPVAIARNIAPLSLMLWPAIVAVQGYVGGWLRSTLIALLLFISVLAIMGSVHEASKLAIVVGGTAWVIGYVSTRWATGLLRAVWLAATLLPVPIAVVMYEAGLHKVSWLQYSAKHRVEIWHRSALNAVQSPIIGNGAMSTYVASERFARNDPLSRLAPPHQHNVFLQIWDELGIIGALLLAWFGWRLIGVIAGFEQRLRPYAFALFASSAALAAASYGLWQIWFLATFGMAFVAFAAGRLAHRSWRSGDGSAGDVNGVGRDHSSVGLR